MFWLSAAATAAAAHLIAAGAPAGFDQLASPREVLVDVYFGGEKVSDSLILAGLGSIKFRSPAEVLTKLPQLIGSPQLSAEFAGELPVNSALVCSQSTAGACGILKPETVGVIYDPDHFRVDVFVNPKMLRVTAARTSGYLPAPQAELSLVDSLGVQAGGTIGGRSAYNIQNRTIVGFGGARIRADTSFTSDLGLIADDLVAEVDRKNLRYSAGLFWAPGDEFTGQRRIVGAGFGTQFDTWADREALRATPLVVLLPDPARVELIVDGRTVNARTYSAGYFDLDTSALPEGSYPLLVRIRHANGSVDEQQRFFVKNSQVPPPGHAIFYAYAGALASTRRDRLISPSRTLYYQAGVARRLTNKIALDGELIGTQHKAILKGGAWLLARSARVRAAGLVSNRGDLGALLEISSAGHGPFTMSLDVRRIWSRHGGPLIPAPVYATTFDTTPAIGFQLASGSYTQAIGSIGLQLGAAFLSVVGSYRSDAHQHADYAIGPSFNLPVITRNGLQLVFEASGQRTRSSTAVFAGFRVFAASPHFSMLSTLGQGLQHHRRDGEPSASRVVGSVSAQYSKESADRTLINIEAGADRNVDSATLHTGATLDSSLGNLRADLLHDLEGSHSTEYDLSFQSGFALGRHAARWGSRDLEQSAIVVSLTGEARASAFTVLVDHVPKGVLKVGQSLSLFVPPYRTYRLRLVPTASSSVSFDTAEREVTVYPGNVRKLTWRAESFFTVFGQAISPAGDPIADAAVQTAKGISETDSDGYFQVDMRRGDLITVAPSVNAPCSIKLGDLIVNDDFASIGKVVCK